MPWRLSSCLVKRVPFCFIELRAAVLEREILGVFLLMPHISQHSLLLEYLHSMGLSA